MSSVHADSSGHGFLRYACVESSVGRLLVAMSDEGVVDVILGETRQQLLSKALQRFPGTGFLPDRGRHAAWVAAVVKRIELRDACGATPLHLRYGQQARAAG